MFEEQTISSDKIYTGKNISLRIDTVETNNKGYQKREIIEHGGVVAVVAINENKEVVLIKQFRKAIEKVIWEIPAGKIESGETPKETALRELKEETGYIANNIRLIHKFYTTPGFSNQKIYLYLATDISKSNSELEISEDIETFTMDFDKAYEMVVKNEIEDAKSSIGLLFSKKLIKEI
ncbi:MAG: NUDIX hydrolase [Peptostreptococcaceae bacterium]